MTGRINVTPEAERQLNEIDAWITSAASADTARRFVTAVLDHIDAIGDFRSPAAPATTSDLACEPARFGREPSSPTRWTSLLVSAWCTSSASSTVDRTGRQCSARPTAIRVRHSDPPR